MRGGAVVVGVGESEYYKRGGAPETEFQLAIKAIRRAAEDAGLDLSQIDGLISYMDDRNDPLRMAAALGMRDLRWSATPWAGGGNNSSAAVQLADAAVCGGYADYVVAFRSLAQGQFYRLGSSFGGASAARGEYAWRHPYGLISPAQECALHTKRFMHDHGVSQEALCRHLPRVLCECPAEPARGPSTEARSHERGLPCVPHDRRAVPPLRLLSRERRSRGNHRHHPGAREGPEAATPCSILADLPGTGTEHRHRLLPGADGSPACSTRSRRRDAVAASGHPSPADVDVLQLYENFTGTGRDGALRARLLRAGMTSRPSSPNGALEGPDARSSRSTRAAATSARPTSTDSRCVNEAVRQIRGTSTCQVARTSNSPWPSAVPATHRAAPCSLDPSEPPPTRSPLENAHVSIPRRSAFLLPVLDPHNTPWFTDGRAQDPALPCDCGAAISSRPRIVCRRPAWANDLDFRHDAR